MWNNSINVVSSPHDLQTIILSSSSHLPPGLLASISLFHTLLLQPLLFLLHSPPPLPQLLSILRSSCILPPLSQLWFLGLLREVSLFPLQPSLLACLSSMVGRGRPRLIFLLQSPELQVLRMIPHWFQPPREQVCTHISRDWRISSRVSYILKTLLVKSLFCSANKKTTSVILWNITV